MKIKCKKVEKLFGAYVYNAVTPTERAYVENHISQCPDCAKDLLSRKRTLEVFKPQEGDIGIPPVMDDRFALNVYKRIALDYLKRQSRKAYIQRFVLQPSFAVLIIAFSITTFFLRFHPGQVFIVTKEPTAVAIKTEEVEEKDLRASLYVDEFFQREGSSYKNETKPAEPVKVAEAKSEDLKDEKPSPETPKLLASALTPDPKSLLEEANFLNFSMGDRKRALAQYQKLVDNYPNTEAAAAAGEMIKSIRDFEYRVQNRNSSIQTVDLEI